MKPAAEETVNVVLGDPAKGRVLQLGVSPVACEAEISGGRCPSASMDSCSMEAAILSGTLCGGKEKFKNFGVKKCGYGIKIPEAERTKKLEADSYIPEENPRQIWG